MPETTPRLGLLLPLGNENVSREVLNEAYRKIDSGVALQSEIDDLQNQIDNIQVPDASTTQKGIVQLYNGVNSTSQTLAATANSVKTAYDLANNGMVYRGAAPSNFNDASTLNGTYGYNNSGSINIPSGLTGDQRFGALVVNVAGSYVTQQYVAVVSGELWERSRPSYEAWTPWVKVLTSNGPQAISGSLRVDSGALPSTAGAVQETAYFGGTNTNSTGLSVRQVRTANGSDWNSTAIDLRRKTDTTDQAVLRFQGDNVLFQNADASWTSLRDLKQLSNDVKTKVANAVVGKGGSASASMTGDQLAAAITALVPRQAYVSDSNTAASGSAGDAVRKTHFTFPTGTRFATFHADSSASTLTRMITPSGTQTRTASNYIELVDADGRVAVVVQNDITNQGGTVDKYINGFIYDANAGTVRIMEPSGARSISLPGGWRTDAAVIIRSRFIRPNAAAGDIQMYAQIVGQLTYL